MTAALLCLAIDCENFIYKDKISCHFIFTVLHLYFCSIYCGNISCDKISLLAITIIFTSENSQSRLE